MAPRIASGLPPRVSRPRAAKKDFDYKMGGVRDNLKEEMGNWRMNLGMGVLGGVDSFRATFIHLLGARRGRENEQEQMVDEEELVERIIRSSGIGKKVANRISKSRKDSIVVAKAVASKKAHAAKENGGLWNGKGDEKTWTWEGVDEAIREKRVAKEVEADLDTLEEFEEERIAVDAVEKTTGQEKVDGGSLDEGLDNWTDAVDYFEQRFEDSVKHLTAVAAGAYPIEKLRNRRGTRQTFLSQVGKIPETVSRDLQSIQYVEQMHSLAHHASMMSSSPSSFNQMSASEFPWKPLESAFGGMEAALTPPSYGGFGSTPVAPMLPYKSFGSVPVASMFPYKGFGSMTESPPSFGGFGSASAPAPSYKGRGESNSPSSFTGVKGSTSPSHRNMKTAPTLSNSYKIMGPAPYHGPWIYSESEATTEDESREQGMMETRSQKKQRNSRSKETEPPITPSRKDTAEVEVPGAPRKTRKKQRGR